MTTPTLALSTILYQSSRCLAQVESGHSLTGALVQTPRHMRGATQAIAWYAMRHWGLARAWRSHLLAKHPNKPWLAAHIALSLLLLDAAMMADDPELTRSWQAPLDEDCPTYTPYTLVDQAVQAVSMAKFGKPASGLVNAVMRRFQRERAACVMAVQDDPVAQWRYPRWWVDKIRKHYPAQWQDILGASRKRARLVLRVNRRQATVAQVVHAFTEAGVQATPIGEHALVLPSSVVVDTLPGFNEGWWSVQDWSAQQAAGLLDLQDNQRVLDACAAPGGKTAHVLEIANVELTAIDQDASRLARVEENLTRLKLMSSHVRLQVADATRPADWFDGQPYDRILADVPCTASGVVRRHPDIAWLRRESDLAQTVKLQTQILDALWELLAPGGILLLVTCSVFPEEGEQQALAFVQRHRDALRLEAPGQCLPQASLGSHTGQDGFFYAKFQRKPNGT